METVERLFDSVGKDHYGTVKTNYQVIILADILLIQINYLIHQTIVDITIFLYSLYKDNALRKIIMFAHLTSKC